MAFSCSKHRSQPSGGRSGRTWLYLCVTSPETEVASKEPIAAGEEDLEAAGESLAADVLKERVRLPRPLPRVVVVPRGAPRPVQSLSCCPSHSDRSCKPLAPAAPASWAFRATVPVRSCWSRPCPLLPPRVPRVEPRAAAACRPREAPRLLKADGVPPRDPLAGFPPRPRGARADIAAYSLYQHWRLFEGKRIGVDD
jgi:hypothetical protein